MQNAFIKADREGDAATHRSGRGRLYPQRGSGRERGGMGRCRRVAADESGAAGGERYGQKMSVGGSALYWAKASAAHGE